MDNSEILETIESLDLEEEIKSLENYLCCASNQLNDNYIAKCRIKSALEAIRGISSALYMIKKKLKRTWTKLKWYRKLFRKFISRKKQKEKWNETGYKRKNRRIFFRSK